MSIKSSQKSSEISVGKLRRAYKTKDLLSLSVRARGIEYVNVTMFWRNATSRSIHS